MDTLDHIDSAIQTLTDTSHQDLFDRWRREYTQRYYGTADRTTLPNEHTGYPGFENNFHALLFNALKDKDPHSEWPYASYIDKSSERVDIHIINNTAEAWLELGMYASDERAKYYKDFLKLVSVIDNSPNSIGILIHFEIYERDVVAAIFQEMQTQYCNRYGIDTKYFENANRMIACRLSVQKKER